MKWAKKHTLNESRDMGVSFNGGTPENTLKWSFWVVKTMVTMVVGYQHFRKHPYVGHYNTPWSKDPGWCHQQTRVVRFVLKVSWISKGKQEASLKHQEFIPGWWQLKYVLFSPLLGEDLHFFSEHSFQMRWNHRLENIQPDTWKILLGKGETST